MTETTTIEILWDDQDPNDTGWMYREYAIHELEDGAGDHHEEVDSGAINNLADLCGALNKAVGNDSIDVYARNGEPSEHEGGIDDLPNFGGQEPECTLGVFSWDEGHLLVHDGSEWVIVPRPSAAE